ncbi:hypothetical protein Tco_0998472, partial [Tanacetum coccineum]
QEHMDTMIQCMIKEDSYLKSLSSTLLEWSWLKSSAGKYAIRMKLLCNTAEDATLIID